MTDLFFIWVIIILKTTFNAYGQYFDGNLLFEYHHFFLCTEFEDGLNQRLAANTEKERNDWVRK